MGSNSSKLVGFAIVMGLFFGGLPATTGQDDPEPSPTSPTPSPEPSNQTEPPPPPPNSDGEPTPAPNHPTGANGSSSNEGNGTGLPDLTATLAGPIEFDAPDPATVALQVTNAGQAQSNATKLRLTVGPNGEAREFSIGLPPLDPGETWQRDHPVSFPFGFSPFRLEADPDGTVVELNETNNAASSWAFRRRGEPVETPEPVRLEAKNGTQADNTTVQVGSYPDAIELRFDVRSEDHIDALVDRAWVDSRLDGASLENATYQIVGRGARSFYSFDLPSGQTTVAFRSFEPATDATRFGHGSPSNVLLESRPMGVLVQSVPRDEPVPPGETDGTTANRTWHTPWLVLSIEDGNPLGQNVWLNKTWLQSFGVGRPAVFYKDGTRVPVDEHDRHWIVRAPHFSVLDIRTDDLFAGGYYNFDYTDDTAAKWVPMPGLTGAYDAWLFLWAHASACGPTGNSMMLQIDDVDFVGFNPCDRWGTTSPSWSGFQIPLDKIHNNVKFSLRKTTGSWMDRNIAIHYDTSASCAYSSAKQNGVFICNELSWSFQLHRNPSTWNEGGAAGAADRSPYGRTLSVTGSPSTATASNSRYGVGYQLDGSTQYLTANGAGVNFRSIGDAAWFFSWNRAASTSEDVLVTQGELGGGINKNSYGFHCLSGSTALTIEHSDSGGTPHPVTFAGKCPTGEHALAVRRLAQSQVYEVSLDGGAWTTGTYTGNIASTGGNGICVGMRSNADQCSGGLAGGCACNFYELRIWKMQLSRTALTNMATSDTYRFTTEGTEDAVYSFSTTGSSNNPPSLAYEGGAGYTTDGVQPDSGTSSTTFLFKVKYTDPDGTTPSYVRVHIDGDGGRTMSYASGSITTGAVYTYSTLLGTGTHSYHFEASDGVAPAARLPSTGDLTGPSVSTSNSAPTLALAGTTGYTNDGVEPDSATSSSTFTFRVKYTDADGTWPSYVRVVIDTSTLRTMTYLSGSITTGAIYTHSTTLLRGTHWYHFEASDGTAPAVRLPASGEYSGPTATNTPPTACFNKPPSISGLSVTVTSCSTDWDNDPLTLTWNWGDSTSTNGGTQASHSYACPGGTFTITLTAADGQGGVTFDAYTFAVSDFDNDNDGLKNCQEGPTGLYQTYPDNPDSDGDGLNDGVELAKWNTIGPNAWNTNYDRLSTDKNNLLKWDADRDGIKDSFEFDPPPAAFGINTGGCENVGGRNECPNPTIRDVYVQLNWLVKPGTNCFLGFCVEPGHSDAPTQGDIDTVRGNFNTWNNAPGRANADKILLHLYVGRNGDGNGGFTEHTDIVDMDSKPGSWNDIYDYKNDWTRGLLPTRNGYFIFVLFVHQLRNRGALGGGAGEVFGNDHAVAKEVYRNFDAKEMRAAWMMELGHNLLGLHHSLPCLNGGHVHNYWHNPAATHLDWTDDEFPANITVDEGNNQNGNCDTPTVTYRDEVQDIFSHAGSISDAMGFNYYPGNSGSNGATTWIETGWLALRPDKAVPLAPQGVNDDAHAHDESGHDHGGLLPDQVSDMIHDGIHGPPVIHMKPRLPLL